MTIVESIVCVLKDSATGMTASEIYNEIVKRKLYCFGAKNPLAVVNNQIRRRCVGLDFPTAYPNKLFDISGYNGNKPTFVIFNDHAIDLKPLIKRDIKEHDALPEEKISIALAEHIDDIRNQVLDCVLNNSPAFFEHLVMDLLLKMGYGYDKNSGIITGRSHDGGIDGIINEDKLGLDLIYIQAKRYNVKNTVGSKEVQAFVGAMGSVNKGVFITTSKFSKDAIKFIERHPKNVKLIDGNLLSELLVRYQVGVSTVQTLILYKIDSDYYNF